MESTSESGAETVARPIAYELDHLFVCCEVGAPEADVLIGFGLSEGRPNRHLGQGTANRRFFFENAMLELLWVEDPGEAESPLARPIRLGQRWARRGSGMSPFGVCLRAVDPAVTEPPFASFEYRPTFFSDGTVAHVSEDASLLEPMWFFIAGARRPDKLPKASRPPLKHATGFKALTDARLIVPGVVPFSAAALAVGCAGGVTVVRGVAHGVELEFDGGKQRRSRDLRPVLPIAIRW